MDKITLINGEDGNLRQLITDLLSTRGIAPPQVSIPFGVAWFMARCMESTWRVLAER